MTDENETPAPANNSGNPFSCLLTVGAVCILAAALFFAGRESFLVLARSVTGAGQEIIKAQAAQEREKTRALEIENERKAAQVAEQKARDAEMTKQILVYTQYAVLLLFVVCALIACVIVIQTIRAAPEVRAALVYRAQLEASKVHQDAPGTWPILRLQNGQTFNPNLQLEPGQAMDDKLAQGYYYTQGLRVMGESARGIASRVSNPQSQAADALPGIAQNVNLIE